MRAAILRVGLALPARPGLELAEEAADPALRRDARRMSRAAWLATKAVGAALQGSKADSERTAAFYDVGPSSGAVLDIAAVLAASVTDGHIDLPRFARAGVAACNPLLTFQLMNNFTLCHAAIREGLQGESGAFFHGGQHAMIEAITALSDAEHALAGGADTTLHPLARREQKAAGEAGEAAEGAVALLLRRDAPSRFSPPLAWVEICEETGGESSADLSAEARARFGDCGAANESLCWLLAIERLAVCEHFTWRRLRFSRAAPAVRQPRATRSSPVVITGAGAISALGPDLAALHRGLTQNICAVAEAPHLPGFPPCAAVADADLALSGWISAELRASWAGRGWLLDRRLPLAVIAALQAWRAAGEPSGLALSIGLGLEQALLPAWLPLIHDRRLDWSRDQGQILRAPLDLPARALAELLPLSHTLVNASACAAGTLAVAQAAAWVQRGEAEAVLCGAADSMLNPLGLGGLMRLGVVSPSGCCRPFDRRRDGVIVGEGAAFFVVEREDRALARGAVPLARVVGWAGSQDGYAPTAPRPGGEPAFRAMKLALQRAGLVPGDVDAICAHGTGTPPNDEAESAAIQRLFPVLPPVFSLKGAFGHAMAAAGALELAGCLLALGGTLPGTVGFEREDSAAALPISPMAQAWGGRRILKNSFGFGGQNASLILEAP